jgi:hypothetical protein
MFALLPGLAGHPRKAATAVGLWRAHCRCAAGRVDVSSLEASAPFREPFSAPPLASLALGSEHRSRSRERSMPVDSAFLSAVVDPLVVSKDSSSSWCSSGVPFVVSKGLGGDDRVVECGGQPEKIRHEPETNTSVRGAGRCASMLCLRLSHHFFSEPLRSPLSARAPQLLLYPSLGCSRGDGSATQHSSRARENSWGERSREPAAAVHDRLLVGCRSSGAPPPGEACLPWFSDPGGNLALQAKEPVFHFSQWFVSSLPRLVLCICPGSSCDCGRVFPC